MIGSFLVSFLLLASSVNVRVQSNISTNSNISVRQQARIEVQKRIQEALEASQQTREEFRARLQGIKDEVKRKVLERIDLKIADLNTKWVNHAQDALDRLSQILGKAEGRAARLKENGVDTSGAEAKIAIANDKINKAQKAVNNQAGKVYLINIDDEANVGQNVKSLVATFKADIKTMMEAVRQAHKALVDVLTSLKSST